MRFFRGKSEKNAIFRDFFDLHIDICVRKEHNVFRCPDIRACIYTQDRFVSADRRRGHRVLLPG